MTPMQLAGWTAHASMPAYRRVIERSAATMRNHPGFAVSVSWGKDSVVMLHLACQTLGRVVAVHGRYSSNEELPDIPEIRDRILAMLGDRVTYVEAPVWGDWEIFERAGRFFLAPETPREHAILKAWKSEFVSAIENEAVRNGATGMMIGSCAHESRARQLNIAMRGDSYTAKGRIPTLLPLARWRADDICAYHVANKLPWLRIYEQAEDPRRARSEFAFAAGGGDAIRRHGAFEQWRNVYPDLYRHWQKRWGIHG